MKNVFHLPPITITLPKGTVIHMGEFGAIASLREDTFFTVEAQPEESPTHDPDKINDHLVSLTLRASRVPLTVKH